MCMTLDLLDFGVKYTVSRGQIIIHNFWPENHFNVLWLTWNAIDKGNENIAMKGLYCATTQ